MWATDPTATNNRSLGSIVTHFVASIEARVPPPSYIYDGGNYTTAMKSLTTTNDPKSVVCTAVQSEAPLIRLPIADYTLYCYYTLLRCQYPQLATFYRSRTDAARRGKTADGRRYTIATQCLTGSHERALVFTYIPLHLPTDISIIIMYIYMCAMCVYACKIRTRTHNNIIYTYLYNIVNDRELRKQTEPRVLPTRIRRFYIIITSLL